MKQEHTSRDDHNVYEVQLSAGIWDLFGHAGPEGVRERDGGNVVKNSLHLVICLLYATFFKTKKKEREGEVYVVGS